MTLEYYYLVQCCDNLPCTKNDKPLRLVFNGVTSNSIHPDNLLSVVMTSITDVNRNKVEGCFKLTEAITPCNTETEDVPFEDFIFDYSCVATCKECLPDVPAEVVDRTKIKVIYGEAFYNGLDTDKVETIMCKFALTTYKQMMQLRHGISYCCMDDSLENVINFKLTQMDLVDNSEVCCP